MLQLSQSHHPTQQNQLGGKVSVSLNLAFLLRRFSTCFVCATRKEYGVDVFAKFSNRLLPLIKFLPK